MDESSLAGASVAVTGAGTGRGLGREIPMGFARAGANLTLNVHGEHPETLTSLLGEIREYGVDVHVVEGDISTEPVAAGVTETACREYGRLDVLVNNAAISTPTLCHEMSLDVWQRMIDVTLTGAFLATRAALGPMRRQRSGRIVNISSQIGQKGGVAHAHYAAAKAGLIAFTKSVALEVGAMGITANCVAPGPLDTRLLENVSEEWLDAKLHELVIPRLGQPEEVVPSVLFLASSPAGNLYTGQTLGPNCGDVMP